MINTMKKQFKKLSKRAYYFYLGMYFILMTLVILPLICVPNVLNAHTILLYLSMCLASLVSLFTLITWEKEYGIAYKLDLLISNSKRTEQ